MTGPLLKCVAYGSTVIPGIKSSVDMEENTAYCSAASAFDDADTSLKTYHAVYEEIK